MASTIQKLKQEADLDDALSTDGADSELSLADDTDEFSLSFSGTLRFDDEDGNSNTKKPAVNPGI